MVARACDSAPVRSKELLDGTGGSVEATVVELVGQRHTSLCMLTKALPVISPSWVWRESTRMLLDESVVNFNQLLTDSQYFSAKVYEAHSLLLKSQVQ